MNGRKLSTDQANALKKAALRKGRISDVQPHRKRPDGAERREFARAREMEHKIEEFFTAPRNFDFSIDDKKQKRWSKGKVSKEAQTWHTPVSSRYKVARLAFLSEKYRKFTITAVTILVVVVLVWLSATLNGGQRRTPANAGIGGDQTSQVLVDPDFDVIEPGGGAETPTQFDPSTGVASFADRLNDGSIVVSQQKVPEDKQDDETFLLGVSQAFSATKSFKTDNGEAFVGTNEDNGVQFVAFLLKDNLFLIQSEFTQTDDEWRDYINTF